MNAGCEAGTTTVAGASARGLRQPTQRLLVKWGRRSVISASEKWLKRFRWLTEVQYNCNRALRIEKKMVRYLFFLEWNWVYRGKRKKAVLRKSMKCAYCCTTQSSSKWNHWHISPCLSPLYLWNTSWSKSFHHQTRFLILQSVTGVNVPCCSFTVLTNNSSIHTRPFTTLVTFTTTCPPPGSSSVCHLWVLLHLNSAPTSPFL